MYDGQAEKDEEKKGIGKYTRTYTVAMKIMLEIYEGEVVDKDYSGWGRLFKGCWSKANGCTFTIHTGYFENNEPSGYGIRWENDIEGSEQRGLWKGDDVFDVPTEEEQGEDDEKIKVFDESMYLGEKAAAAADNRTDDGDGDEDSSSPDGSPKKAKGRPKKKAAPKKAAKGKKGKDSPSIIDDINNQLNMVDS